MRGRLAGHRVATAGPEGIGRMAGTNKGRDAVVGGPAVVLVDPQLGENIGMVARAMLNCGLMELRLVRPRDGWPNPAAEAAAAGAVEVLDAARVFDTTAEAVADLTRVYATSARPRDMVKPVMTPHAAAAEMREAKEAGETVGILFGPERAGLTNDDLTLAGRVIEVPLNPAFASLNLAQAVLVVGYEWFQAGDGTPPRRLPRGGARAATEAELANLFDRLEAGLDRAEFFHPPEMRPHMRRNLRNIFQRADLTEVEVRTLHGVVTALLKARPPKADD
jgi:tRNA/rRNA methyltransferase